MNAFLLSLLVLASAAEVRAAGTTRPVEGLSAASPKAALERGAVEEAEASTAASLPEVPELDPRSFEQAVAGFDAYAAELRPFVKNEDNLPFILTHGAKTRRSILMIHGLTDSPYYMRTLAQTFFDRGYNVVAVLLPGHGTRPEDLLHVRLRAWRESVEFGLRIAEQLGDEVSLAGFSTGGALALDALNKNFTERDEPRLLGGLYLFSPAIEIANPNAYQACIPGASLIRPYVQDAGTVEDHPFRYRKMATNAVCQLYKLAAANALDREQNLTFLGGHRIPVFAVQSKADTTVRPEAVDAFMRDAGADAELVSYPEELAVAHADTTRPEAHPEAYRGMEARLNAFIERRESPPPGPRAPLETAPSETLELLRKEAEPGRR